MMEQTKVSKLIWNSLSMVDSTLNKNNFYSDYSY